VAEYTRQTYYASAKAILIPRFDDSLTGTKTPEPPKKRQQVRRGIGKDKSQAALHVEKVDGKFVLIAPGDDPTSIGSPQQQKGPQDHEIIVLPRSANLGHNGPKDGKRLSLEVKFRDFPIDPRTIRSCAVEFYLGTVSADDFSRGIAGETRRVGDAGASGVSFEPLHLVPSEWTDHNGQTRSNLRFQGFVDEWEATFDEDEPIVKLECTDNARLIIGQFAPPQLAIDPALPIDEAIAKYLANFPQFRGLSVQYLGKNPPKLKGSLGPTAYQPKLGPPPKGGSGASGTTVWDYFVDVTGALGMFVRMEGTTIIVQTPRRFFSAEQRQDDPYRPRRLAGSQSTLDHRTFVYGRNLSDVTFTRNFTRFAPFNVEVRSYDPRRKNVSVARFPEKKDRVTNVNPGNAADQKWHVLRLDFPMDPASLKAYAQSIYEQQGRRELTVKFDTDNLSSYGRGNEDPDILDMRVGDTIDVQINRSDAGEHEEFNLPLDGAKLQLLQIERTMGLMQKLGYPEDFARAYATAYTNQLGFVTLYKVRKFGIDWNESDGVKIDVEGINYVLVRANVGNSTGVEPEPGTPDGAADDVDTVTVKD
jgi:hypothetical protein